MGVGEFRTYMDAMDKCSKLAQIELAKVWNRIKDEPPAIQRDALIEASIAIVKRFGDIAALAAAEYYEDERSQAIQEPYEALLAETVPDEQIEASVRYACGHLDWGEDGD